MHKLQHILNSVSIISKKYEDIAKITGENFNVFSVLSMERKEVKTHSAFLGELLNPKGSHSLNDIFLKLFIQEMSQYFINDSFSYFDTSTAIAFIEESIGKTNEEKTEGGRIDIIIKDSKKNVILIENKIDANEQTNQLIRYNNAYPNAAIFFLTLTGYDSETAENVRYHKISYDLHVIKWLEECLKEAVNFPMLREVIKQYIYLIKKLTNQTMNENMTEEIVSLMAKSTKESFEISNNVWKLKQNIYQNFMKLIKMYAEQKGMIVNEINLEINKEYGLYIKPNSWKESCFNICIIFESSNYKGFYYGVSYEEGISETDKTKMREKFKKNLFEESEWWIWRYSVNKDWADNGLIWEDVSNGINSKAYQEIIDGINKILEIEKEL